MPQRLTRRKVLTAAAGAAVAFPFVGCGRSGTPRNVILIISDAMRADRMGAMRDGKSITPNLDRLAARGAHFTNCYSTSSHTKPSMASILTGAFPAYHGVLELHRALPSGCQTIAAMLARRGYECIGLQTNPWLAGEPGQSKSPDAAGFQRDFHTYTYLLPEMEGLATGWAAYRDGSVLVDSAADILASRRKNVFLYLHFMETHQPWMGPAPRESTGCFSSPGHSRDREKMYAEDKRIVMKTSDDPASLTQGERRRLLELYDEAAHYVDGLVGRLMDIVEKRGGLGNTLFIFTSDHGEEFFERGGVGHGRSLYGEVTRVPLVIAGQSVMPAKVSSQVSNVAIYETVRALVCPQDNARAPLVHPLVSPESTAKREDDEIFAELHLTKREEGGTLTKLVTSEKHEAIVTQGRQGQVETTEVYDLAADPGELAPIDSSDSQALAEKALKLRRTWRGIGAQDGVEPVFSKIKWQHQFVRASASHAGADKPAKMTEHMAEQLRALGYLN